jgi:oxygen-dependent protoporphyrinogen oxidase
VFAGLAGGVARLVQALLADLRARDVALRSGTAVRRLAWGAHGRWQLVCGSAAEPEPLEADGVLLALPAGPAGRLAADLLPSAAAYAAVPYASVAVVTLVVRGLGSERSGLLIPPGESPTIKALTHSSVKWDWVRERAEAAWGPGVDVVRASVGRIGENALLQLDDEALVGRTFAEALTLPGWAGVELVHARLTRWGGALPQYRVGHRELVARLREDLGQVPGLALAGAALDGVGIAACVGSATTATTKIVDDLGLDGHDQDVGHEQREESRR